MYYVFMPERQNYTTNFNACTLALVPKANSLGLLISIFCHIAAAIRNWRPWTSY